MMSVMKNNITNFLFVSVVFTILLLNLRSSIENYILSDSYLMEIENISDNSSTLFVNDLMQISEQNKVEIYSKRNQGDSVNYYTTAEEKISNDIIKISEKSLVSNEFEDLATEKLESLELYVKGEQEDYNQFVVELNSKYSITESGEYKPQFWEGLTTEYQQTLILIFIIFSISVFSYFNKSLKEINILRIEGYNLLKIYCLKIKKPLLLLNFFNLFCLLVLMLILKESTIILDIIKWQLLIINGIYLILSVLIFFVLSFDFNYKYINGDNKLYIINNLMKVAKIFVIIFIFSAVFIIIRSKGYLVELNNQKDQLEYMNDYYVSSMYDSSFVESEISEDQVEGNAQAYHKLASKEIGGFYINYSAINKEAAEELDMSFEETGMVQCSGVCFYYASENYLDFTTILDENGERITSDDIASDEIVLLTTDEFQSDTILYEILQEDLKRTIKVEKKQKYPYFELSQDGVQYYEEVDIPIFIIGNESQNQVNQRISGSVSSGRYMTRENPAEIVHGTDIEGFVVAESVKDIVQGLIDQTQKSISNSIIKVVIYLVLIFIFSYQLILLFVQDNRKDISIKVLEGYPTIKLYKYYFIETVVLYTVAVLISSLLGRYSSIDWQIKIISLLLISCIDIFILLILNKWIIKENILNTLKGEK